MARIRSVKPEFFTSLSIADLSYVARLAFIGLWTHVDDDGRCIDEPRLIKAALFPLDDDMTASEVDVVLDELAKHERLIRYEASGRRFIQVIGWAHQKIDRKKDSEYPPPECSPSPRRAIDDDAASAQRGRGEPSSPDRIGSGSGRDLSSSSSVLPVGTAPQAVDEGQGRVEGVLRLYVDRKLASLPPGSVRAVGPWSAKTLENAKREHVDTITDWLERFDVTDGQIADALVAGCIPASWNVCRRGSSHYGNGEGV